MKVIVSYDAVTGHKGIIGSANQILKTDGAGYSFDDVNAPQAVAAIASDVTLTNLTINLVDTSAVRSLALPSANTNLYLIIKDKTGSAGSNNITITTPGSETIDGVSTATISNAYGSLIIVSDGTNYFAI